MNFFNAQQVAEIFFNGSCNYHKVLRLTREGLIPAKKVGKSYLYKVSELDAWAKKFFSSSDNFSNSKEVV